MAQFNFRMQTLLDLRKREEDALRVEHAEIVRARNSIENMLREQQRKITEQKSGMRDRLIGVVDTDALRLHAHAALGLMREAQTAAVELAGLARREERARGSLVAAQSRRRAVELLRERRLAEWRQEQERREVAELDDLVSVAAHRKEIRP